MKRTALLVCLTLQASAALADSLPQRICVEARRRDDYTARAVGRHDIVVRNTAGRDRRPLRLETTCVHIEPGAVVYVHSFTGCIGLGDDVIAASLDNRAELCRVSGSRPFIEGSVLPPYD